MEKTIHKVKFSYTQPDADRRHYINEVDVKVVLSRLPHELWQMLKAVHFNDHSIGDRRFGCVNKGRRVIAICALPPRAGLGWNHELYGDLKGAQWPTRALRRSQLYDTFLHELGRLQIILPDRSNPGRKYAGETKAREFANYWRKKLGTERFDHPDPIHNPPSKEELRLLRRGG